MGSSKANKTHTTVTSQRITSGSHVGKQKGKPSLSRYSLRGATRKSPIRLRIVESTPKYVLDTILKDWGNWIEFEGEELIALERDTGFQEFTKKSTPGEWLSGLRESTGITQKQLGKTLGGVSPARISDWEHDRRSISKEYAKQLSKIFNVSVGVFL